MRINAFSILAIGTLAGCGGAEDGSRSTARHTTESPPAAPATSGDPVADTAAPAAAAPVTSDTSPPAVTDPPAKSDAPPPAATDTAPPAKSDTPPPAATGTVPPALDDPPPAIDDSLARLGDLNVVHVEELLVGLPQAAYSCYGFCSDWKDEYEAAAPAAAPRLAKFVDAAAAAAESAPECASCSERVDENLGKLRELALFRVVDIIVDRAQNNPNCYSLPCAEDIAAARTKNAERAAKLEAIVEATRGL